MKVYRWVALILVVVCIIGVTGCVAPFYGTARIEEGFHAEAGVSGLSYIGGLVEYNEPCIGVIGDVALSYGFNPHLQIGTRLGLGYGQTGSLVWDVDEEKRVNPWELFPDAALNVQVAFPYKFVVPALRIEYSYSHGISAALLLGVGAPEKITFGVRGNAFGAPAIAGLDLLLVVRPISGVSIFAGFDPFVSALEEGFWPVATLGIGYKLR